VCRPLDEVIALARTRVTRTFTPEELQRYLHESPVIEVAGGRN
jgi:hypothetical protein